MENSDSNRCWKYIGLATAQLYVEQGVNVPLVERSQGDLQKALEFISSDLASSYIAERSEKTQAAIAKSVPMKRYATAREIAQLILF